MTLSAEISACRVCAEFLEHTPRPVVQFSRTSRILIVGQAPGSKVQASGIAWDDASGERLREWTGLSAATLHDETRVAIVPMGFCYPGRVPKDKGGGGDKPPRPECAPLWHERVLQSLPADRTTLLVGQYAQAHYLPHTRKLSMTDRVRRHAEFYPFIPLPHPAWRSAIWMKKNPWFATDVLPALRREIQRRLA